MPAPITLPDDTSSPDLRKQIAATGRRLRANALTLALATRFDDLLAKWTVINEAELDHADKVDDAVINVTAVDGELNAFVQHTSSAAILSGNGRDSAFYQHLFKGKPVNLFVKPVLNEQLESMKAWVVPLQKSEHPALTALGAELPALLEKADKAAETRVQAEQAEKEFREVGDRKTFIDEVNAARKETYGVLATLPHKHPGLPSRFADQFFKRYRPRREAPDLESVEASIEKLKKELAAQEKLREELLAAEAQEKALAEEQAKLAAKEKLAAIQREIEQKQKEAAALAEALKPAGQ